MVTALKPSRGWSADRTRGNKWKGNSARIKAQSHMSAWVMQDIILDHLDPRSPRTKDELAEALAYDYGAFEVRTLHRNLVELIRIGLVAREEEWALHLGRMVPTYRRLGSTMPPPGHRRAKAARIEVEPLNLIPVGPWPGYRVLMVSERYSPRPMGSVSVKNMRRKFPGGFFRPRPDTKSRRDAIRAARRTSAGSPGSPPRVATSSQRSRPPSGARPAR